MRVEVVTTADTTPAQRSYPVHWASRGSALRHVRAALLVREAARRADVVYATSMIRRAAVGSRLAGRPLVVKLVSDEVFERATRSGRYVGTLDEFQREGGARTRFLRATRNAALRRARHVFCPSAYLREIACRWGLETARVSVLPNPAPKIPAMPPRDRASCGVRTRGECARLRRSAGAAEVARNRPSGACLRARRHARRCGRWAGAWRTGAPGT